MPGIEILKQLPPVDEAAVDSALAAELAARTDDREPVVVWGTRHRSWWPVSWAA